VIIVLTCIDYDSAFDSADEKSFSEGPILARFTVYNKAICAMPMNNTATVQKFVSLFLSYPFSRAVF